MIENLDVPMIVELNGMEFHLAVKSPPGGLHVQIADEEFRKPQVSAYVETSDHVVEILADYAGMRIDDATKSTLRSRVCALATTDSGNSGHKNTKNCTH